MRKIVEWLSTINKQTDDGHEVPDPKPVAIPLGAQRPADLADQVRRLVRREVSDIAAGRDFESWEEANDFEVEEDFDPSTPFETIYDPDLGRELTPRDYQENWPAIRSEVETHLRNRIRAEARDRDLEAVERRLVDEAAKPGVKGPSPSPSS